MAYLDKTWMQDTNRLGNIYRAGVKTCLDFAFAHTTRDIISCPCIKCNNVNNKTRSEVEEDLVVDGIVQNYTRWLKHGESAHQSAAANNQNVNEGVEGNDCDDIQGMIFDLAGDPNMQPMIQEILTDQELEEPRNEAAKFYRLLDDAQVKLYPGCEKFSRLSFTVKLYHIKCISGWGNKSLTMLLELLKESHPTGNKVPSSCYEAKKIIHDLGLNYNKIDAYSNDCMLFRNEHKAAENCVVCGASRWKNVTDHLNDKSDQFSLSQTGKKIPVKVLRHFPLKSRLQRLYMSSKTSSEMTWHHDKRVDDGFFRHPADSEVWKNFNQLYPSFSNEPRNIRLGLASDGFNPFGTMSLAHSTWPDVIY